jgi:hypothetical protein
MRIAFGEAQDPIEWIIINYTIDSLFLLDIFIIFNSAYYDNEFIIVDDRKEITNSYLKGWFSIDTFAIIPFDLILRNNSEQGD